MIESKPSPSNALLCTTCWPSSCLYSSWLSVSSSISSSFSTIIFSPSSTVFLSLLCIFLLHLRFFTVLFAYKWSPHLLLLLHCHPFYPCAFTRVSLLVSKQKSYIWINHHKEQICRHDYFIKRAKFVVIILNIIISNFYLPTTNPVPLLNQNPPQQALLGWFSAGHLGFGSWDLISFGSSLVWDD